MLAGAIDRLSDQKISGWAFNRADPDEHLSIRIEGAGSLAAIGTADAHRKDLAGLLGEGDHAFAIAVPSSLNVLDLTVIAQSKTHGSIVLQTKQEKDYNLAVKNLREEISEMSTIVQSLLDRDYGADIPRRVEAIESRLDATEVFFVRFDEMMRKLIEEQKKRRKRWLGIF